jgi:two-component sensor histidine kinase
MNTRPFHGDNETVLLTELNHRLCNTFQIIASQIARCERVTPCQIVKPLLGELDERLQCLAALYRMLAKPEPDGLLEDHVRRLCVLLLQAFDREDVTPWVRMEDLPLPPDQAGKVGLIVVELVTNVLKHSLHGDSGGAIWIDMRAKSHGAEIAVSDSRESPVQDDTPPIILSQLAASLSGEAFVADRCGYTAGVWFPLEAWPPGQLRRHGRRP